MTSEGIGAGQYEEEYMKPNPSSQGTAQVRLAERCTACNGSGTASDGKTCAQCRGAGSLPTEAGQAILNLVRKHIRRSDLRD